jgi:hypothetical protein
VPAVRDVLLATCVDWPEGEPGGDLLVHDLARRGIDARWVPWDDATTDWAAAELVAVRSTWDYEWCREEFVSWARAVGPRLLHGADVLAWNIDKSYLLDLEAAGLPVVPTIVATTLVDVEQAAARFGRAVCKPTVGASGRGVGVIDGASSPTVTGAGPWLVQPLVESVRTEGETSVFVLDGQAVSQVRKLPGGDEIRVHEEYGGRSDAVPLGEEHAALATRTVQVASELTGGDLACARVDLMRLADGVLALGELELIEPGLYLDLVPGNAEAFGAMVERRLA